MRQTTPDPIIPPDHLIDPRVGQTGFRGHATLAPPTSWEIQHEFAETGGYFRIGRRWTTSGASTPIPVRTVPVLVLYRPLFDRHQGQLEGLQAMGWCVDA